MPSDKSWEVFVAMVIVELTILSVIGIYVTFPNGTMIACIPAGPCAVGAG